MSLDLHIPFIDGFVKSPYAALRFTFVAAAYPPSTPHSSGFARLASGAFSLPSTLMAFYKIIKHLYFEFG
ncbi:MAG: hypothetical protein NTY64_05380 [Deltaproteobacteria bacterium]|nr:hypothetical protein [Deltaproteobacteria bacterium]